jgi:ATP-dependent RNA helicase MSS116
MLCCVANGFAASRRPPRIRPHKPSSSSDTGDEAEDENNHRIDLHRRRHEQALQDPSLLSKIPFSERSDIHPATQRALTEGMGLISMTQIQAQTYTPALEGKSIMARSRTGSGKTLAFLLPSLERLLQRDLDLYRPGRSIGMIVLAPTRELAVQIAEEAERLLEYHPKSSGLTVACLFGGVKMQRDLRLLSGGSSPPRLPTILVATPGRLLEHLESNTRIEGMKFTDTVDDTKIVVLDETDRLWESHQRETKKILSFLARTEKRQSLLFSATFPKSVRCMLKESLLKGQKHMVEVDCIDDHDGQSESQPRRSVSHRIQQSFVVLKDMSQYIPTLLAIIRREQQVRRGTNKILVFFPAGRMVRFFYHFFTLGDTKLFSGRTNDQENVWEIHSRMSQSSRMRASDSFRRSETGVLLTSDVSARGLDYPDVTLVVQMGAPSSKQAYIHRIGRTGRAGQEGRGILVLLPFEKQAKSIADTINSIQKDQELSAWLGDDCCAGRSHNAMTQTLLQNCRVDLESTQMKIRSGHAVLTPSAEAAYKAFAGHYLSTRPSIKRKKSSGLKPGDMHCYAVDFANATGLMQLPDLDEEIAADISL